MKALFFSLLWCSFCLTEVPRDVFPEPVSALRGKILVVVTSTGTNPNTQKPIGYEFTELSRACYLFEANGFAVEIASPLGGKAPAVIDDEDMTDLDRAFLADPDMVPKWEETLALDQVSASDYQAIYFVGGKGAFFDFPENPALQRITAELYEEGGVVSAVCHGPAALLNVTLSDGSHLLAGKRVSSFTNEEELLLNGQAAAVYPFLLEDALRARGATFEEAPLFLNQCSVDGRLVTGQNPWSTWEVAEQTIRALGYEPVKRVRTAGEATVESIAALRAEGLAAAEKVKRQSERYDHGFLAQYTVVAIVDGDLKTTINLIRLSDHTWIWVSVLVVLLLILAAVFLLIRKLFRRLFRGRTVRSAVAH